MIELLHELKKTVFNISIQAFDNVSAGERKTKFSGLEYITKNLKFSCVLYAHSQFLCSSFANLAFLKPDFEILAFFNTFGFFGIKKARKIWLFSGVLSVG